MFHNFRGRSIGQYQVLIQGSSYSCSSQTPVSPFPLTTGSQTKKAKMVIHWCATGGSCQYHMACSQQNLERFAYQYITRFHTDSTANGWMMLQSPSAVFPLVQLWWLLFALFIRHHTTDNEAHHLHKIATTNTETHNTQRVHSQACTPKKDKDRDDLRENHRENEQMIRTSGPEVTKSSFSSKRCDSMHSSATKKRMIWKKRLSFPHTSFSASTTFHTDIRKQTRKWRVPQMLGSPNPKNTVFVQKFSATTSEISI